MWHAEKTDRITRIEEENRCLSRLAAQEGIVLLKNNGKTLPLSPCKTALFGNGARKTVKGGCGSGDVNDRYVVSFEQGLINAGFSIADTTWLDKYDECFEKDLLDWKHELFDQTAKRKTHIDVVYLETPHLLPVGDLIIENDLPEAELAFYVLARRSGEGSDRRYIEGDYLLSEIEKRNIRLLASYYERFVLVLNVPGPVEISEFQSSEDVDAILLICQGGLEIGNAAVNIITGKVTPSAHLSDTWGKSYFDYPSAEQFDHFEQIDTVYEEGIFVGYRWFDHKKYVPLYPFGYGLSYTDFSYSAFSYELNDKNIHISLKVTNSGQYPGKDVVQVYCAQPEGRLPKTKRLLVGFDKTKLLEPGKSQELIIQISRRNLASYDEAERKWVIEKGNYCFYIGSSISDCTLFMQIDLEEAVIKKQNQKLSISPSVKKVVDALSLEDKLRLVTGAAPADQIAVIGNGSISVVGAAGETAYLSDEIPGLVMADGGSGIRLVSHFKTDIDDKLIPPDPMAGLERGAFCDHKESEIEGNDYYQYCTSFPVGTMLAQTWNRDLLMEIGRAVSKEMIHFGIDLWLSPSVNIHRNPLCGRNFEYYSEDPLLSGELASALCIGVQEIGKTGVTVKHFACNNQEYLRSKMNSIVSVQALCEIYLRVFEIIIEKVKPFTIMTSYNQVNGVHAANNGFLCNEIARQEWGYDGIFMSDWGTTHHGESDPALCIKNGNDLIMPGRQKDRDRIREAIEEGTLKEEELNACVERIISLVWKIRKEFNDGKKEI